MSDIQFTDSVNQDPLEIANFLKLHDPAFFASEYQIYEPTKAVFIAARLEGRLVGTQALIPYPLTVNGRLVTSGRSERTMADPKLRGGGLFQKLMEECARRGFEKELEFIWGTTTAKVAFQRNGFLYFDKFLEHSITCINPFSIFANLREPQSGRLRVAKLVTALPSLFLRVARIFGGMRGLQIEDTPRDAEDVAKLLEELRGTAPMVFMHHEHGFLKWQLDGTNRNILRFYGYRANDLRAYAYFDVSPGATTELIDFGGLAPDLRVLLRYSLQTLAGRGVVFVHATYNARNPLLKRARDALILNGFIPFYRGGGFVVRPLRSKDMTYLSDLSRWYITQLWIQIYRMDKQGH